MTPQIEKNMKFKLIILLCLYFFGAVSIVLLYTLNLENNIILYSLFFTIVVIINKKALLFYKEKNKKYKFLLFSLIPFILYLLFVLIFKQTYFIRYKILIILPICLSFYQIFKFVNKKESP